MAEHRDRLDWIPLFDEVASEYDQIVPFFSAFARELIDWIAPSAPIDVLDLATGRGAILSAFIGRGERESTYIGVDLSAQMLRNTERDFARRGFANVRFAPMNAEQLDFDDESFDLVTCGFALHLFDDPNHALSEVFRVLRPGGIFAFSTPGPSSGGGAEFYDALIREVAARIPPSTRDQSRLRAIPMLTDAGFVDIETTEVEIHLPVETPESFWNGELSHGRRRFFEQLSALDLAELRTRLFEFLERAQANGGIVLDRGSVFRRARKPGGEVPPRR